ncbi:hypothetical protein SteCoe_31005 [Stentor coeruleus]|uniref:Uncharacterized protein n=1 Tax=Stentor coeruleus TaxID=5963 RepID=A0A1R2B2B2_9CILI|nr:hypothetical protein SteCoe_31005 [Stentor coeruleus]
MINEKGIDKLLEKLSCSLGSLQGTYKDFASKCDKIDKRNYSLRNSISRNPDFIQESILDLKETLAIDSKIFIELKDSLETLDKKCRESLGLVKIPDQFSKNIQKSLVYLTKLFQSDFINIEQRFDELLETIQSMLDKNRPSNSSTRNFEAELSIAKSLSYGDVKPLLKRWSISELQSPQSPKCLDCQKVYNESKTIINKTGSVVNKINSHTFEWPKEENLEKSHHQIMSFPSDNNYELSMATEQFVSMKSVENLKKEIESLKTCLKNAENNSKSNFYKLENDSLLMETNCKNIKIADLESELQQKSFKIQELMMLLENLNHQKTNSQNLSSEIKLNLENHINNLNLKIKKLEFECMENAQTITKKVEKIEKLEEESTNYKTKCERLEEKCLKLQEFATKKIEKVKKTKEKMTEINKNVESNEKLIEMLVEKDMELRKYKEILSFQEGDLFEKTQDLQQMLISYEKIKELLEETKEKNIELNEKSQEYKKIIEEIKEKNIELNEKSQEYKKAIEEKYESLNDENKRIKTILLEAIEKEKSMKIQEDQNKIFNEKITTLETKVSELNEQIEVLQERNEELDEFNSELLKKIENKELQVSTINSNSEILKESNETLKQKLKSENETKEKLVKDNESLVESQNFISDYINSLKESYEKAMSSLKTQIDQLKKKIIEHEQTIHLQQYLYNKLQSEKTIIEPSNKFRKFNRQKTSPAGSDSSQLKSIEALKKIFDTKTLDFNIAAIIGIELDESDPEKFVDRIVELKKERDTYYVASERSEDLINELKEVLNEENENNLLNCVVKLKGNSNSVKTIKKKK